MLTAQQARELFDYNPETGALTWRARTGNDRGSRIFNAKFAGKPAGYVNDNGYVYVNHRNKMVGAHRIIWLMVTGEWPEQLVDHINGEPADNRWCNLRAATPSQNMHNMKTPKHSTSKMKGVGWDKHYKKWRAHINVGGKYHHIGYFADVEDAIVARKAAAERLHKDYARHA